MKRLFTITAGTISILLTIGILLSWTCGRLTTVAANQAWLQAQAGSPPLTLSRTRPVADYSQLTAGNLQPSPDASSYARPTVTRETDRWRLISSFDTANLDLKVTHCPDQACASASSSSTSTIDSQGDVGQNSSITIGADGLGLISYYDATNARLKVAHCSNTACASATTATIDTASFGTTSITIGADGLGLISYYDYAYFGLKVAHCSNIGCTSATTAVIDGTGGAFSSITIGADGLGLISYVPGGNVLKVAHCSNIVCSFATTTILDAYAGSSSIMIGADGLGVISYTDEANRLKVAHCADLACT